MSDLKSLGYVTISTNHIDRWRQFAFGVLGFAEGKGPDPTALYLRMDERPARLVVVPGDTERVLTVGWEVRDRAALQRVMAALDGAGVAFKQLSADGAEARRVEEVITFEDPGGHTLEVFHGAVLDHSPVITPFGARFVTGAQGMGHVVLPSTDPDLLFDFYTQVLGFRSRGAFRVPLPKEFGPVRVRFLGINQRHHSLAIVPAAHQRDPRVVHIMVEVDSLDAVGQALDRVNAEGFQLSSTLGRHTNDKMVSFYVRAPGDWDIEFGTDGMRVDETYYTAEEITADSYWGHQWVGEMPAAMRL
ncbi:biphenyl-2,3-diol 1,2-dioxygenase [Mycobacterium saskatchewanense]|uniref:2,3-dihydroxybiphenyl 1,2-dioxygenase n=1 Tax=Mycobacterium saskatchewanense TaxID=220927 RepID=A0AAJ3NMZ0_9MYCO|nr:VOC family protein [Mycobacterium saskatchewanense]ORW70142.1 2,3-dihydroxybiphenyl 1,2-dioxygenase [Mycobacterium saskatchewanense]BBX61385.1 biphenyl-2,3-diol 1,2-dioxygenase [Mycobacterium saskatchewanense]